MSTSTTDASRHFLLLQDMSYKRVALIKRPPLVRSFSPNLNTHCSNNASLSHHRSEPKKPKKSVRFCEKENVRLFLKTQMPKACRSDPSPNTSCVNNAFHIRRPNWPTSSSPIPTNKAVWLQNVQLSKQLQLSTITLFGSVQVANLAFQKKVIVRYTLNDWHTVKETEAHYQAPVADTANTWDRFSFKIVVKTAHHRRLYLAVKYTVSGRDFWDNNNQENYQVDIVKLDGQQDSPSSDDDDDDDEDFFFEDCITTTHEYHPALDMQKVYKLKLAPPPPPPPPPSPPSPPPAITPPLWMSASNSNTYFAAAAATHMQWR